MKPLALYVTCALCNQRWTSGNDVGVGVALTIDIHARVFGAQDKAYRLFPGTRYRHYRVMREHSVVFLDYPGMPLPGADGYLKTDASREEIIRAERRSAVVYTDSPAVGQRLADIAQLDLGNTRWSQRRELSLGWLNGLYKTAQVGDLVIVPAPFRRIDEDDAFRTLIGEIVSEPFRWTAEAPGPYRLAGVVARRVRWLAEVDERDLDARTLRSLRTQNALVSLNAANLRNVLGAAYKNVVVEDDFLARFITRGEEFTARESYHFQAFALAVAEAYRRHKDGGAQFDRSIYELAASLRRGDPNIPEQDVSIHSPGYTTLKSVRDIVFVISALFAAALTDPAAAFDVTQQQVEIFVENTASPDYDPCEPGGLEESTRGALAIMGYDRWQEACRAAVAANEDEGFEPRSTAR